MVTLTILLGIMPFLSAVMTIVSVHSVSKVRKTMTEYYTVFPEKYKKRQRTVNNIFTNTEESNGKFYNYFENFSDMYAPYKPNYWNIFKDASKIFMASSLFGLPVLAYVLATGQTKNVLNVAFLDNYAMTKKFRQKLEAKRQHDLDRILFRDNLYYLETDILPVEKLQKVQEVQKINLI